MSQVRAIADLVLAQTASRLSERGIGLEVTEATLAHICEEGYDQARLADAVCSVLGGSSCMIRTARCGTAQHSTDPCLTICSTLTAETTRAGTDARVHMVLVLQPGASLPQAYGARPLRRAVTAIVEDPLAEALLHGRVTAGQTAVVDRADDGTITVRTRWHPGQPFGSFSARLPKSVTAKLGRHER